MSRLKNRSDFLGPQSVLPPQESLAIFPCDGKSQAIAIPVAIFQGKERPHCGVAGDRDICDKNHVDPRLRVLLLFLDGGNSALVMGF